MSLHTHNLHVSVEGKEILKGLDLVLEKGQVHAIMGPNGSGKSTLANTLMGHPKYKITDGPILLDGVDITMLETDKRAKLGLFLSLQYPPEIAGVTISNFLRNAVESQTGVKQNPIAFYRALQEKMKELRIDPDFANRYVNAGFSGGEKKRAEILQLSVLNPKYAILDETDSGLDVDALRVVSEGINKFRGPDRGVLLITHYNRILEYVKPDVVHVMMDGRIVRSGGAELAAEVEVSGYGEFLLSSRAQ
ncbi:MAG: Fe-S cluster assembly ATPase SufC [Candidatus Magasanikbacteria bacterium RIFCSPHIGHO2_02_FULL_51_14]|uniref:Fe-S cluster assembly ATPase SufC n=1 Tax=Candidatus Magasanikbacteria bacterium RIFCSPHIGHO2_02_FULL_51_14 TaxID=1798683 RepID=A0A1F6MHJ4_9BACT|nr:MAG: Fe-S cluster assembly ATPase SufC [Candidatus Magasanikbacteria bacterium RIFCSPHIGHO2_02_FULL_51_14]